MLERVLVINSRPLVKLTILSRILNASRIHPRFSAQLPAALLFQHQYFLFCDLLEDVQLYRSLLFF